MGPFILVPVLGLLALVSAVAAGASKKKPDDYVGPGGTNPLPDAPSPAPTFPPSPVPNIDPSKVAELVKSAIGSGQVATMQQAASVLRQAGYPEQAAQLEALAAQIAAKAIPSIPSPLPGVPPIPPVPAIPAAPKVPSVPVPAVTPGIAQNLPGGPPVAPVTPAGNPMQSVIDAARAAAHAVGDELTVQDIDDILHGKIPSFPRVKVSPSPLPTIPVTPIPGLMVDQAGKDRAGKLALALKFAKKSTASEPKTLVKDFQTAEHLSPADGMYGSAVAIILADKYGIVPPQAPFYWGKKNDYNSIAPDKANYRAVLLKHAAAEPQRADEWNNAAKQVK
jgi:hypothetical protein